LKISALKLDPKNANKGTKRGRKAIQDSLTRFGAGRSILIDKNGVVIAGNQTIQQANALGNPDVLVVKTDGSQLVAVMRTDLEANDAKARELAIVDNRASELGLEWDPEVLADAKDLDLKAWFPNQELIEIIAPAFNADDGPGDGANADADTEIDVDSFQLAHKCPRCQFEFNDK